MPGSSLIDHSPQQPEPAPRLASASRLVLIDNYDSFTWNVYQYLHLEGATVIVHRNDKITVDKLIAINPTQLVISPGPGHPDSDAGISLEAIKYFAGKIPVLGVCMGEQCIFSVFGGKVELTGQILHGKTSELLHDGKGIYAGLPQNIPVTRYHSLAGTHTSLPSCLEVSSWIAGNRDGAQGIIMGVRHKELLVEGVQFHPESILTAEGRSMLKTFLKMKGGTWAENKQSQESDGVTPVNGVDELIAQKSPSYKQESILERIYSHTKLAVEAQKMIPSRRPADLQAAYGLNLAPPQISFPQRLRSSRYPLSLMAEVKRASPSKGVIATDACAPAQAREYALAGADVISVLTEPEWFKGSLEDLRMVRQSLEGMSNRPAVLRKEFIFDEYQILEARLAGADSILLIVKMLEEIQLKCLYDYSRKLGMEPLVEVNNIEEMAMAIKLGACVIGVNNRNLTNFEVDLDTTTRLMSMKTENMIVAALSGISGPNDVKAYTQSGVDAVLVGEALMRAEDTALFVQKLLGSPQEVRHEEKHDILVKICGTRTVDAAKSAIEAGADLIGIILVPGRKRCVHPDAALAISRIVHGTKKPQSQKYPEPEMKASTGTTEYFKHTASYFRNVHRALLVGVFQNQSLDEILHQQKSLDLDVVQLHGSEPLEWASLIPVPVIHRFGPNDIGLARRGYHSLPLLDSASGGTGEKQDLGAVRQRLDADKGLRVILAGGLTPENVAGSIQQAQGPDLNIVAVDVSSGVEEDGSQDLEKIRQFIAAAKNAV